MKPVDISSHIEKLKSRHEEIKLKLSDPAIYTRSEECRKISRENQKIEELFKNYARWSSLLKQLDENRKMLQDEDDELKNLAIAEIETLEKEIPILENKVMTSLIPQDPNDSKNTIVEIRPAAGGEEASLFSAELYRMYMRYSESKGWKLETLDMSSSGLGGIKEVIFSVSGDDVYAYLKYESGVQRVQRVPATEASGRIHTSTVTVSVLPEVEAVEFEIKPQDLKFDVFRSSGPGGQSVNTTDSAVRATHIPTGLSVASQQEKSQHRNKETALRILRARLFEIQREQEAAKQSAAKKAQVGTGDRSEKIRTYNFHQNRVTDHRFNITLHDLPRIMDGDLDFILEPIIAIDAERKLAAL